MDYQRNRILRINCDEKEFQYVLNEIEGFKNGKVFFTEDFDEIVIKVDRSGILKDQQNNISNDLTCQTSEVKYFGGHKVIPQLPKTFKIVK